MGTMIVAFKIGRGNTLKSFRLGIGWIAVSIATLTYELAVNQNSSLSIQVVMLALLTYGVGEFLISPSITAHLANITPQKNMLRGLMGTLSLSTAVGNILSFYAMKLTYDNTTDMHTNITGDTNLFALLSLFLIGFWVIIYIVSYIKNVGEGKKNGRKPKNKHVERDKR